MLRAPYADAGQLVIDAQGIAEASGTPGYVRVWGLDDGRVFPLLEVEAHIDPWRADGVRFSGPICIGAAIHLKGRLL